MVTTEIYDSCSLKELVDIRKHRHETICEYKRFHTDENSAALYPNLHGSVPFRLLGIKHDLRDIEEIINTLTGTGCKHYYEYRRQHSAESSNET